MANGVSKTQIDRLGDRLRKHEISDDDLRLLDLYRRDFFEAYEIVISTVREQLSLEPTGRPAKSTTSISDKLRRESIRLSQVQDIAGCRLITSDIAAQEATVELLVGLFEKLNVVDRRKHPSHGYRAVHVIVNCLGKSIEIQIRTELQHLWAEFSEKFSDVADPAIKYGGGDKEIQTILIRSSNSVAQTELCEKLLSDSATRLSAKSNFTETDKRELAEIQKELDNVREELVNTFRQSIEKLTKLKY